ncbi:MAG: hypothetical protein ABR562_05900 [Thermoplasmatota archaeon]|nr:hypothetical protein [Halobacteriales archaeon]
MRWSWPSWLAIVLGVLAAVAAFALVPKSNADLAPALLVGGAILIGAGLHALQSAWSSCGGCYGGCDCDHCEGCKGGECCGNCGCYGESHEGHGHDGGHSH